MISGVGSAAGSSRAERDAGATTHLKNVNGDFVGVVRFEALRGDKIEVWANVTGVVPQGDQFHGLHLHTTGKCDPEAVDSETDQKVPFFSAGDISTPAPTTTASTRATFLCCWSCPLGYSRMTAQRKSSTASCGDIATAGIMGR